MTVACTVGEAPDGVAQPNLLVLEEDIAARMTVGANQLSIAGNAGELANVRPGDVVVSNGPEPFLRKVVRVRSDAGQLALETVPAALTDAILEGHAHSNRDLLSEPVPQTPGQPELIIPIERLALDFGGTKLLDEAGLQVSVNRGTVSFRPYVDVDLQIEDGSLASFHAILHGELEASIGVTINSERSFSRGFSKTLWESPAYKATQYIGNIPVVEVVRVSLVLTGEAHSSVRGRVDLGSAKAKASLEAGASYADGRWRAVADPSIAFETRGPVFEAGATAGVSVRLTTRVDVKFYDIAGPHVIVGAYARTELRDSYEDGLSWTGRAGMDATFGGNVAVLGETLASYERKLFDLGRDFAPIPAR
ncbi:MAG: hypothetical protein H0T89_32990 [Deltaproteobacteria bacterium]|nr:hypothetical protein [Deltaproteobacteria bacterium]MDQ3295635.1 hypothetical protein [Myxococcota bacterium]